MGEHWRRAAFRCAAVGLAVAVVIPAASGVAAETKASAVPAKLVGQWSRNVTKANWNKYGDYASPWGVWTIGITKKGVMSLFPAGYPCCTHPYSMTQVSVAAASLTIGSLRGVCSTKGTYGWKLSGQSLTLKVIADKQCPSRIALFNGIWKRK